MTPFENLEAATQGKAYALTPEDYAAEMEKAAAPFRMVPYLCTINRDLVNAVGTSLRLPKKTAGVTAVKYDTDTGIQLLNERTTFDYVTAQTYLIATKASWSIQDQKAVAADLIAEEIQSAGEAIANYENETLVSVIDAGVADANTFAAAAAGTLAYEDILNGWSKIRQSKFGRTPNRIAVCVHADQAVDLMSDAKFIDKQKLIQLGQLNLTDAAIGVITGIGPVYAMDDLTAGTAYMVDTAKALKFVEKQPLTTEEFKPNPLENEVWAWEIADIKVVFDTAMAKITSC